MQLNYQGQAHSVEVGTAERLQTLCVYAVPPSYQGGLFVAVTPAGEIEQVPPTLGRDTTLLLRGTLAPGEELAVEYLAEGVGLG
ncbi:hypothetical protein D9M68_303250 [compost metagenome]